jgi:hypothetical protein
VYCVVAAVELLIGHQFWLCREDFVQRFIEVDTSVGATAVALVDWAAAVRVLNAGRLACSTSQGQVLRVAASLAEGVPVDLREALSGLDQRNLALVAAAVLAAGGWPAGLSAQADSQVPPIGAGVWR